MKKYIPVEIPTKRYIKAYVQSQLGDKPVMMQDHYIGNKLYDVLQHRTNEDKKDFANQRYNEKLKIYISMHVFQKRGCYLNETNVKNFNSFIEQHLKDKYRFLMDFYMEILPSFENNLPHVRKLIGIDDDAWSTDSIKKDYYRYRIEVGKPLLYKKTSSVTVPQQPYTPQGF